MADGPLAGYIKHASLAHLMPFEGRPPSIASEQSISFPKALAKKRLSSPNPTILSVT
jgi:hypothetical protein